MPRPKALALGRDMDSRAETARSGGPRPMQLFLSAFDDIPDPRAANARHDLAELLVMAFVAVLCGATSCAEMAAFCHAKERVFRDLPRSASSYSARTAKKRRRTSLRCRRGNDLGPELVEARQAQRGQHARQRVDVDFAGGHTQASRRASKLSSEGWATATSLGSAVCFGLRRSSSRTGSGTRPRIVSHVVV